jgi:hypothetical protein
MLEKNMSHNSQSELFSLNKNRTATVGMILQIPKIYLPGKFILNLVYLMKIKLQLSGFIKGTETDNFNWLFLKATGKVENLIATLAYLQDMQIATNLFNLNEFYGDRS